MERIFEKGGATLRYYSRDGGSDDGWNDGALSGAFRSLVLFLPTEKKEKEFPPSV